ncbi:MAG TPA: hypothetical protein VKX17_20235 [Planctomycetota bacterium]|nr:hypothetical protein [Planctomycetota bacterium]
MAMDATDKKLINGLIVGAILVAVLYFYPFGWPFDGYGEMLAKQEAARVTLKSVEKDYAPHYGPLLPAHFGQSGEIDPNTLLSDSAAISELDRLYKEANAFVANQIDEKQKSNRIAFPEWTDVPKEFQHSTLAGHYFRSIWEKDRNKMVDLCVSANVELDDHDIGFKTLSATLFDEPKARELLRELHIAETIITLCVNAKKDEETREHSLGKKPEAFMRIMQVEPRASEATGPTALLPNPKFDPKILNPADPKFRKYLVKSWPVFIQEYPVKIQLMCDTNTFIHFMHSVRAEGQFLVIRQLEVLSPFLDDSKADKSEERDFKSDSTDANARKRWPQKDEQVIVTMNVSGMDFFDPKVNPRGLYEGKKESGPASTGGRRRLGPTRPGVATPPPQ